MPPSSQQAEGLAKYIAYSTLYATNCFFFIFIFPSLITYVFWESFQDLSENTYSHSEIAKARHFPVP